MSKHFRFGRKRIRNIEDVKLNPTGWGDVGIGGAVIIIPLVAVLIAMMTIPRFYYLSPDVIMGLLAAGLIGWVALILAYYGQVKSEGASLIWHDTEFGFDERHHPRYEIKLTPQDIRLLYSPEDEMKNKDLFNDRVKSLGFDEPLRQKIEDIFKDEGFNKKYMYYFRHHKSTQECLGIDLHRSEVKEFHSHIRFQDKPYNQQYVHSEGQENWHKGMLFNHPHAEQDGVKVLGWGLDFTTNEPMPLCLLTYNSLQYKREEEKKKEKDNFELLNGMATIMATQHNALNTLTKEKEQYEGLFEGKLVETDGALQTGQKIAERYIQLYEKTKKPVSRRLWSQGWFKAAVTIAMMVCIVVLVIYVLQWLGYVRFG